MVQIKHIKTDDVDDILRDFDTFNVNVVLPNTLDFKNFNPYRDRVCKFYYIRVCKSVYKSLWPLIRKLLLISHGQATVERGFSVNRQVEENNLSERSHVALRQIHDYVQTVGGIMNVSIDKDVLRNCAAARSRYHQYMSDETTKKRKAEQNASSEMMAEKKRRLQTDIEHMTKSADELAYKAEGETGQQSRDLLLKSNAIRRDITRKRDELNSSRSSVILA